MDIGGLLKTLLDPQTIAWFATGFCGVCLLLGFSSKSKWENVDFVYYVFAILGVISLFISELDGLEKRMPVAGNRLSEGFVALYDNVDPRENLSKEEWTENLNSFHFPIEEKIELGCNEKGFERLCRVRASVDQKNTTSEGLLSYVDLAGPTYEEICDEWLLDVSSGLGDV